MTTETKATHTPGPWRAEIRDLTASTDDGRLCFVGYIVAGDRELAVLYSDTDRETNARLIAAAPELLAACKLAVEAFPIDQFGEAERRRELCRKAIAKAEGK
jgi:hypothetical protein